MKLAPSSSLNSRSRGKQVHPRLREQTMSEWYPAEKAQHWRKLVILLKISNKRRICKKYNQYHISFL